MLSIMFLKFCLHALMCFPFLRKVLTGKVSTLFPVNYVSYAWHGKLSLTKSQALLLCQM